MCARALCAREANTPTRDPLHVLVPGAVPPRGFPTLGMEATLKGFHQTGTGTVGLTRGKEKKIEKSRMNHGMPLDFAQCFGVSGEAFGMAPDNRPDITGKGDPMRYDELMSEADKWRKAANDVHDKLPQGEVAVGMVKTYTDAARLAFEMARELRMLLKDQAVEENRREKAEKAAERARARKSRAKKPAEAQNSDEGYPDVY